MVSLCAAVRDSLRAGGSTRLFAIWLCSREDCKAGDEARSSARHAALGLTDAFG
jgi:hypothetical protein